MTQKEDKCVAGCKHFTGGEVRHHKHCPFYPDSFSKMYDKMKQKECSNRQKLLDDFAKAVMHGMISNNWVNLPVSDEAIAKEAYDIATAMIQERERRMK